MNADGGIELRQALSTLEESRELWAATELKILGGMAFSEVKSNLVRLSDLVGELTKAGQAMANRVDLGDMLAFSSKAREVKEALRDVNLTLQLGLTSDKALRRFSLALAEFGWLFDIQEVAEGLVGERREDAAGTSRQRAGSKRVMSSPAGEDPAHAGGRLRVFVVHGHDEAAKQDVARTVEKLGMDAVILHEQPNMGRTIVEKFEEYSNVDYAVVLLTPDDFGHARGDSEAGSPRARQNVVLELGFFMAKLGRDRVCALYQEGVDLPSDLRGVLYVPMDANGAWRLLLGKEMRAAGLTVDLNLL